MTQEPKQVAVGREPQTHDHASTRRPYVKPKIESEPLFETVAGSVSKVTFDPLQFCDVDGS